jgi:hypothetical protein
MVSPLAWNLSYRFPVHRISPEFRPAEPGSEPSHLVVYRNRNEDVEFLEINAVTQRLLQLLQENPDWTGHQTVKRIAEELRHPNPDAVLRAGTQLLNDLRARNIVLGTRRASCFGERRDLVDEQAPGHSRCHPSHRFSGPSIP